ncbi:MAG: hypothetical protein WCH11_06215 [Bdellovibrio sp.]
MKKEDKTQSKSIIQGMNLGILLSRRVLRFLGAFQGHRRVWPRLLSLCFCSILGAPQIWAANSEDDKFWAQANGEISQPCVLEEIVPNSACGEAKVLHNETYQVLTTQLKQHRSQGLFWETGRFSFSAVIRPPKPEASEAAKVETKASIGANPETPSKEAKLVRYLGTCQGVGSSKDNALLLLSVSKFGKEGELLKQYGYVPGGIEPLSPPVLGTLEASTLQQLCRELRELKRPSPEIVY